MNNKESATYPDSPYKGHAEHDLVWQLSGDESTARQKCRRCSYRTDWDVPPAELTPWTEDELNEIKAAAAGQVA